MADRIIHKCTPEEAARLSALAAQIEAEKDEIAASHRRRVAAEDEPGLRGELRRRIRESFINPRELASSAGVELDLFMDFQEGLADLPLGAFERLTDRLGLVVHLATPAA
jgi:hypothetical protein